jgi:HPt (histidine-containing phosphotransfer) domain-containing protein
MLDREAALARVGGDAEILVSLVDIFFTEIGPMMDSLRTATKNSDALQVERAAHRIKGSVSIFGAVAATETALELEKIGRSGDPKNASETLALLEQQVAHMQPALEKFRSELQSKL